MTLSGDDIATQTMFKTGATFRRCVVLGPAGTGKRVMTQALVSSTMRQGGSVPLKVPTGTLTTTMCEKNPNADVDAVHTAFFTAFTLSRNVEATEPVPPCVRNIRNLRGIPQDGSHPARAFVMARRSEQVRKRHAPLLAPKKYRRNI